MIDINDIDGALHEIRQMVWLPSTLFQLPAANSEMLSFCLCDLHKRVGELKAAGGSGLENLAAHRCSNRL
jgi:hypothetical protein